MDEREMLAEHQIAALWETITGARFHPGSKAEEFARAIERETLYAARRTTPDRECEWKCDDVDNGIWESSCGESWSFIDGGPVENRMLFCHRCGGKLKTAPTSDKGGAC
ncbi:TPA: hypothetical protein ACT5CR_006874 [Burkholderia cenocepacia]